MTSVQNLKYSLTNLSRCAIVLTTNKNNNSTKVIQEENLQDFPLKHNSFIVNSCDQKCVTSPKLWTQLCEKFNFKALTLNQFDEPCAICGTLDNIEIHHIRSVKDVRVKRMTIYYKVGGQRYFSIAIVEELLYSFRISFCLEPP